MVDEGFQWSEDHWSAQAIPGLKADPVAQAIPWLSGRLLQMAVGFSALLLFAATIWGYQLISSYNQSFQRYVAAQDFRVQALELSKAVTALFHAEARFTETGLEDEHEDVHHTLHDVHTGVTHILETAPSDELRQALTQMNAGLNEHFKALMSFQDTMTDDQSSQRKVFLQIPPDRLQGPLNQILAVAKQTALEVEADFKSTSGQMWVAVGSADLALLIGGTALFALHRRRVQTLATNEKNLSDRNTTLRAAVEDRTTRLGQVETMFKSSLAASNMTMFIQNTDLIVSWIHNPKFGNGASLIGKRDQDFMPPEAWHQTVKFKQEVIKGGVGRHLEYSYSIDGRTIHKWLQIDPIMEAGRVIGIIGVALDVTERRQRESKIEALAAELAHRNQNLIAVISAMARQMLNSSETLNEFKNRFTTRLHSIARSFDLIIGEDWQGAPLLELVHAQIKTVDQALLNRIKISGKEILVRPESAEAIGAAIHELTQNALAYGAFAKPTGSVTIDWWVDTDLFGQNTLSFVWDETDGTDIIPTLNHHGYGMNVLEMIVPKSLNGNAFVVAQPGGLKWRMRCGWTDPTPQKIEDIAYLHA